VLKNVLRKTLVYSKTYKLLSQEAQLTRAVLISGFKELSVANIDDVELGAFYSGFFHITIGFERLMKLVIMLDHMSSYSGAPMSDKSMRDISHNIVKLHSQCSKISLRVSGTALTTSVIEEKAINFLSGFAQYNRYFNLKSLSEIQKNDDPLLEWSRIIDDLAIDEVPRRIVTKVINEARRNYDKNPPSNPVSWYTDFRGHPMFFIDFMVTREKIRVTRPYAAWLLLRIIAPFYRVLVDLHRLADEATTPSTSSYPDIPHLYEFFPFLLTSKTEVIRRKGRIG